MEFSSKWNSNVDFEGKEGKDDWDRVLKIQHKGVKGNFDAEIN